jgi:uncharacterized membrane protein YebE (DUF533 family)
MEALKNWNQQQMPTDPTALAREAPLGLREPQNASEEQELEQRALLMVRAMINAAKADGQIDHQEVERISRKLQAAGSDAEARTFLAEELRKPIDIDVGSHPAGHRVAAVRELVIVSAGRMPLVPHRRTGRAREERVACDWRRAVCQKFAGQTP